MHMQPFIHILQPLSYAPANNYDLEWEVAMVTNTKAELALLLWLCWLPSIKICIFLQCECHLLSSTCVCTDVVKSAIMGKTAHCVTKMRSE